MTTPTQVSFGRKLSRVRKARGLSQEALAEKAEVNRNYIGWIERGERDITLNRIAKLARALNVSPKELFS